MAGKSELIVRELLDRHGRLYAEDAGIRLADRPGPLYQLLVLATLLSAPIPADTAVAAARELFAAGYRSPKAMSEASWQDRVDALGRGHYRRYDERTATMLGDSADLLSSKWHGDLRKLRDESGGDTRGIASRLTEFPGLGSVGRKHLPARGPGHLARRGSLCGRQGDQRSAPGQAARRPRVAGRAAGRQRPARPARRRAGARVAEPAGRQRGYRVRARLIPHARYTTETCRMRPDMSLARFVCSE